MSNEVDIITIEHTLRNIFHKEHIRSIDVSIANKPSDVIYEKQSVLDEEPNYKSRKQ